jgi:16S rRNA (uracil1498-N3)-methyltransferase
MMRQPRVYVDLDLEAGNVLSLPPPAVLHLVQVLRLRGGDGLMLFNGEGRDYPAVILGANRHRVEARLGEPGPPEPPLPLQVHLGLGISKGERMDFALQKAVELGVAEVTPLFAGRAVVRLDGERLTKRLEHWQGVVIAACEQSGRRRLPRLHPAETLESWLTKGHPRPLLLDPSADLPLIDLPPPGPALTVLIGPEGGLSPAERERAYRAGFAGVRLGPRILRTETAPLVALAIAQSQWGDLRD